MAKTKQTKGNAVLRGKIFGLEEKNVTKGKSDDKFSKKLRIRIKTNTDNMHWLNITQWKGSKSKVYLFNDDNEQKIVDWAHRYKFLDDGYEPIGIKCQDKQKNKHNLLPEDFIDFLFDNYNDGDDVFIIAGMTFSKSGNDIYYNYDIKNFYPSTNAIDFEADDFEETADFKVNCVFKDTMSIDGDDLAKVTVFDYIPKPVNLTVHLIQEPNMKEYLEENIESNDIITLEGNIYNVPVYEENKIEDEDDVIGGFGAKKETFKNNNGRQIKGVNRFLYATFIYDDIIKGGYEEESEEEVEEKVENKKTMPWDK